MADKIGTDEYGEILGFEVYKKDNHSRGVSPSTFYTKN